MTEKSGEVSYINLGDRLATSTARVSIATLTYAVARRKDLAEFKATLEYLKQRIGEPSGPFGEYTDYYQAQALFQGDPHCWEKWNEILVRRLKEPAARRQHPGPVQPGDLHVAVAALVGDQLSLSAHLRTVRSFPQPNLYPNVQTIHRAWNF